MHVNKIIESNLYKYGNIIFSFLSDSLAKKLNSNIEIIGIKPSKLYVKDEEVLYCPIKHYCVDKKHELHDKAIQNMCEQVSHAINAINEKFKQNGYNSLYFLAAQDRTPYLTHIFENDKISSSICYGSDFASTNDAYIFSFSIFGKK
jgi:hypothetical protein